MALINIGDEEFDAIDLLAQQRFLVATLEAEISGLQEFMTTRQELIEWLSRVVDQD